MKPTLAAASLLTLALLVFAAVRENYLSEWRVLQREYKGILLNKARDEGERTLARRFRVEIRQIVIPDLHSVDRCVSCHLGVDDPRMADAPKPFAFHPAPLLDNHEIDRFGCTVCHGGQGRATLKRDAHADGGGVFWERPLLPAPFNQSSCGVCHDPAYLKQRGAPALARGFELFRESGCLGCHKNGERGGTLGPALEGVGDRGERLPFARVRGERTAWNWHRRHFGNPQEVVPGSKMPKVRLGGAEVDALTTYVLSLRSVNLTDRMTPRDKQEERYRSWHSIREGAELYRSFCLACHGEGLETVVHDTLRTGIPSIRNPDFLRVSSKDFLFQNIRDGRPGTDMPAWGRLGGGLTEDEISRLAAYLLEGRTDSGGIAFVPSGTADPVNGRRVYEQNCATCHSLSRGRGDCSWLGSPGFQATYNDALMGHTIKYGRAGTLMNPYGKEAGGDLTDQEISDVVRFIRTLK